MESIMMIVPRFGTINRGIEVFALQLGLRLARDHGFRVSVLSAPHSLDCPPLQTIQAGIIPRERLAHWMEQIKMRRILERLGFGPTEIEAWSLIINARHHLPPAEHVDYLLPLAGWRISRWIRKRYPAAKIVSIGEVGVVWPEVAVADGFVALIDHDADAVRHRLPTLPVTTIPNGIDLNQFLPGQGSGQQNHIISVAALVANKGHPFLLDAFLHLPDHVRLSCLGSGPELPHLMSHPAYATGRIQFRQASHADMPAQYQSADLFTLASLDEAFGNVFFEAMACGLPVVAHDCIRHRQVLGEFGTFVDVTKPQAYAQALLAGLQQGNNPQSRTQVLPYGWDRVAQSYADFLRILKA